LKQVAPTKDQKDAELGEGVTKEEGKSMGGLEEELIRVKAQLQHEKVNLVSEKVSTEHYTTSSTMTIPLFFGGIKLWVP
jgi:hypothetical protein